MVNRIFLGFIIILMYAESFGQQAGSQYFTMQSISQGASYNNYALIGKKLNEAPMEGDPFYVFEWRRTHLILRDRDTLGVYSTMYDIQNNLFYFLLDNDEIRAGRGKLIGQFNWKNEAGEKEYFVSTESYSTPGQRAGFYQVVLDGNVQLLKYREIVVKKADYREGIATGRNYDQLLKNDIYLLSRDNEVFELQGKVKKDQEVLNEMGINMDLKSFVKANKMDLREESDLLALVRDLNQTVN